MANSKNYLNVPYAEKDTAKSLGAKWDPAKKKWYAPANTELSSFSKWQTESVSNVRKAKTESAANSALLGTITYAKDKGFIAYSDELPPWN